MEKQLPEVIEIVLNNLGMNGKFIREQLEELAEYKATGLTPSSLVRLPCKSEKEVYQIVGDEIGEINRAIEDFKQVKNINKEFKRQVFDDGAIKHIDMAIEALDKQKLKKVITNYKCGELPEGTAYCPICSAFLSIYHKYCFNCGQRLEEYKRENRTNISDKI